MVKILYGVCGEGRGHISRAQVVLDHLVARGHKAKVVCSANSYLDQLFDTVNVSGRKMVYSGNRVNKLATLLKDASKTILTGFATTRRVLNLTRDYAPDIIITDFDPFVSVASLRYKIPLISVDHQHVISNCALDFPRLAWSCDPLKGFVMTELPARFVTNNNLAEHYFITSFFFPDILSKHAKNTTLVGPVLRNDVAELRPDDKGYVLLYVTSPKLGKRTIDVALMLPYPCKAYGFGFGSYQEGNVTFAESDNGAFLQDLSDCTAVITNGGYTLMSEALFLGKPVFSIPPGGHFEQMLNAYSLRNLGYGLFSPTPTRNDMVEFFERLPSFRQNIARDSKNFNGNQQLFDCLDAKIEELTRTS
jgi:uncharacterized protein (TIGR00661 family)